MFFLARIWIRIRDLDPDWAKMLDPDPDSSQSGSTTLVLIKSIFGLLDKWFRSDNDLSLISGYLIYFLLQVFLEQAVRRRIPTRGL
jgi:hypothetical protein